MSDNWHVIEAHELADMKQHIATLEKLVAGHKQMLNTLIDEHVIIEQSIFYPAIQDLLDDKWGI